LKQQQWTITNYAVLLIAGVAVFAQKPLGLSHLHTYLRWAICLIAASGAAILFRIQWHMADRRIRIEEMQRAHFSEDELRKKIGLTDEEYNDLTDADPCSRRRRHFLRGWEFLTPLLGVLGGAAVLACFYL
jgi:hypothetical protein